MTCIADWPPDDHGLGVRAFLQWAKARRLTGDLHVPFTTAGSPTAPVANDKRRTPSERLLHDQAVPVALRVRRLVRSLYGQPLTRIVRLTTDHVTHASDRVAIRLETPRSRAAAGVLT